jgi:hypothetical protein
MGTYFYYKLSALLYLLSEYIAYLTLYILAYNIVVESFFRLLPYSSLLQEIHDYWMTNVEPLFPQLYKFLMKSKYEMMYTLEKVQTKKKELIKHISRTLQEAYSFFKMELLLPIIGFIFREFITPLWCYIVVPIFERGIFPLLDWWESSHWKIPYDNAKKSIKPYCSILYECAQLYWPYIYEAFSTWILFVGITCVVGSALEVDFPWLHWWYDFYNGMSDLVANFLRKHVYGFDIICDFYEAFALGFGICTVKFLDAFEDSISAWLEIPERILEILRKIFDRKDR